MKPTGPLNPFFPEGFQFPENMGPTNGMKALVKAAMDEGAWGMSSGTFYVPGFYAKPDEIEELAKVVAPYGGAYQSHVELPLLPIATLE